jgi:hypothetical protein
MPRTRYEFFDTLLSAAPFVTLRDHNDDYDDDDDYRVKLQLIDRCKEDSAAL